MSVELSEAPGRRSRKAAGDGAISQDLEALGARVAQRREQAGWSLAQLAQASGVSRSTLLALEHGRQDVTVTRLVAVDRALIARLRELGVSPEPLLRW